MHHFSSLQCRVFSQYHASSATENCNFVLIDSILASTEIIAGKRPKHHFDKEIKKTKRARPERQLCLTKRGCSCTFSVFKQQAAIASQQTKSTFRESQTLRDRETDGVGGKRKGEVTGTHVQGWEEMTATSSLHSSFLLFSPSLLLVYDS